MISGLREWNSALRRWAGAVFLSLLAVGQFHCEPEHPTAEECRSSLANFVRLTRPDLSEVQVQAMTRDDASRDLARICMEKRSRESVLCEIKARDLSELLACQPRESDEN